MQHPGRVVFQPDWFRTQGINNNSSRTQPRNLTLPGLSCLDTDFGWLGGCWDDALAAGASAASMLPGVPGGDEPLRALLSCGIAFTQSVSQIQPHQLCQTAAML